MLERKESPQPQQPITLSISDFLLPEELEVTDESKLPATDRIIATSWRKAPIDIIASELRPYLNYPSTLTYEQMLQKMCQYQDKSSFFGNKSIIVGLLGLGISQHTSGNAIIFPLFGRLIKEKVKLPEPKLLETVNTFLQKLIITIYGEDFSNQLMELTGQIFKSEPPQLNYLNLFFNLPLILRHFVEEKLKKNEKDFSRLNLSFANLSGLNLSGTNLENTNLYNANLRETNLTGTNLSAANLKDADITKATVDEQTKLDKTLLQYCDKRFLGLYNGLDKKIFYTTTILGTYLSWYDESSRNSQITKSYFQELRTRPYKPPDPSTQITAITAQEFIEGWLKKFFAPIVIPIEKKVGLNFLKKIDKKIDQYQLV